jgi:hypothetical protein
LGETSENTNMLLAENGCMCSLGCASIFIMQMMFYVDEVNTKVVDNLLILLVLKFHNHRPDGLGVMGFTISMSGFACSLCRSE